MCKHLREYTAVRKSRWPTPSALADSTDVIRKSQELCTRAPPQSGTVTSRPLKRTVSKAAGRGRATRTPHSHLPSLKHGTTIPQVQVSSAPSNSPQPPYRNRRRPAKSYPPHTHGCLRAPTLSPRQHPLYIISCVHPRVVACATPCHQHRTGHRESASDRRYPPA